MTDRPDDPRPAPDRSSGDRSALESAPLDALVALGELARRARSAPAPPPAEPDRPAEPDAGLGTSPDAETDDGPGAKPDRGNYLGGGLYRYKGGVARKVSVYLSPELVPALKAAGASQKDPRGNDMSEIVEALVREAGYGDG